MMARSTTATTAPRKVVRDVAAFRARQRKRPLPPYENVMDEHAPVEAAVIVADGWKLGPFPRVQLAAPLAWDELCAEHRSWHFHLQAWDPIATVLAANDATPTPAYLSWALELAVDWARNFSDPEISSPFAWYDMALGVRAYRLAYLIDVAARVESVSDDEIAWLLGAADVHRELLSDDQGFAAHSNHGFYQAAGQLALARRLPDLPRMKATAAQASKRFQLLMARHFSDEGVHLEHSPEYQWNLMQGLSGMISSGLVDDPTVVALFSRVQESMAWFVAPNSRVVLLGDSTAREPKIRRLDRVLDDALRFVATKGTDGRPPADSTRLFGLAGYAVLRDRWPEGTEDYSDCSYLAQTCAFHSRVHKHADHMSFVWYDRRREILTDSGRYGYVGQIDQDSDLFQEGFHYSDPRRVYVESTRAHNTVEIDGRSFPRRRVSFFGSRMTQAGESGGVLFAESELYHLRTVRHSRVLLLKPGEWLIVFDWLRDGNEDPHDYRQWFQFAPELHVERAGGEQLIGTFDDGEQVHIAPLLPGRIGELACGQQEPLLGWISRTELAFDPRPSACYSIEHVPAHQFATLVALGSEPIEPDHERARLNVSGRNVRLSWSAGSTRHEVSFARVVGEEFAIEYVVS
jgi:hypothetical protein